ncbi:MULTISPECIES: IS3 family transposase [unclassified Pseudoalteromonas]|uniref:IS3 family transposase n=1 Tax=unclassified Pseudoalteromonas TaxID=194690 RepID=UPI000A30909F|nr:MULTISPECIES: IS3 family transposase [unclassified Pseudoalteromonas]PHQ92829.1 MAG: IS3 family transposase [Pseudoalteromonas sp.]MDN3407172.1 IS3 family transposase [Pseudoalteromonas sp. APC 3218]MDN3410806.1 IS3 family transposase [Pseudoalteromonas sp. APC 3894]MDN3418120.1 IS3 family transposase [Pseudoalteromonas sp. APC 3227]MDN3421828.1 IS3 family transposase [Pseudoalteromonas sp. APC 3895]
MTTKTKRKSYSEEFKEEALKLASKVGFAQAARELSVAESQLYYWLTAALKKASTSDRESTLATENARLKRQLAVQAEELDILKTAGHLLREKSKISRFEFMQSYRSTFSVIRMAKVLCVSPSGFYAWIKSCEHVCKRKQQQQMLDTQVKAVFVDSKERDGARRIQVELAEQGNKHDVKTINRSMGRQGLVAKAARKFKSTTDSKHNLPVAPNLLEQNFTADKPNQKWAGDITYLMTSEGWLYLAVIIDLYSRSVIGWSMSTRMTSSLVCDALQMAIWRRGRPKDVIVHSDRGSQYASHAYRDLLSEHHLMQSMSRKGNCWDNACVESFFHSLKVEAIQYEPIMNRETMRQHVFEYIEIDYNKKRRHSALGYLSPEKFEQLNVA